MTIAAFDTLVSQLECAGVGRDAALKHARGKYPEAAIEKEHEALKRAARREKEIEHAGDMLMQAHGFTVVRFSQPRATKQTPGISDRLYINSQRRLAVFWEAKAATGQQSVAQMDFQTLVESVGWTYLVGTDAVLFDYLNERGVRV